MTATTVSGNGYTGGIQDISGSLGSSLKGYITQDLSRYYTVGSTPIANMPQKVRAAFDEAVKSIDSSDLSRITALILPQNVQNKVYGGYGQTIDYGYIKTKIESALNSESPAKTSDDSKKAYSLFWEAFQKSYSQDNG
jgi:hypothetical protein